MSAQRVKIIGTVFFIVSMLFSYCVWADEIFMNDGERYEGVIVEEHDADIVVKVSKGTMILNKSDIAHIEQSSIEEQKKNFFETAVEYVKSLRKNNWYLFRIKVRRIHNRIFSILKKNVLFQFVARMKGVIKFRSENYGAYCFAVYMVLLIVVTLIFAALRDIIMKIIRRVFKLKQRYDI
ncbi:MAG: hypothetical protein KKH94_06990 [Candidatus Omnitrophica bacterium]|nr:hypothetical protein [Candidatus Omnitrophota bacterium]